MAYTPKTAFQQYMVDQVKFLREGQDKLDSDIKEVKCDLKETKVEISKVREKVTNHEISNARDITSIRVKSGLVVTIITFITMLLGMAFKIFK